MQTCLLYTSIEVVTCPTCGRTQIDLIGLANKVETMVQDIPLDIKVAVMGCVVNGPGEAKEADIGIAGGVGAVSYTHLDSKELFSNLKIAKDTDFEKYLNKCDTIFLNMQDFLSRSNNIQELMERVRKIVLRELRSAYPDVDFFDENDLIESMQDVYAYSRCPFVIIIDEWDCIFREYKQDKDCLLYTSRCV